MAIAHKILVAAYWILRTGQTYAELGGDYLDKRHQSRRAENLVRALQSLGFDVQLSAKPTSAPTVPEAVSPAT
jgi:hypothetical protein